MINPQQTYERRKAKLENGVLDREKCPSVKATVSHVAYGQREGDGLYSRHNVNVNFVTKVDGVELDVLVRFKICRGVIDPDAEPDSVEVTVNNQVVGTMPWYVPFNSVGEMIDTLSRVTFKVCEPSSLLVERPSCINITTSNGFCYLHGILTDNIPYREEDDELFEMPMIAIDINRNSACIVSNVLYPVFAQAFGLSV